MFFFSFIIILYNLQKSIGYETVSLILLLILFLLPVFNFEKGPIILSAVVSALAWDYYFIPPHFTMHIAKAEDVMMLFMFFIIAVTNGVLTSKLKTQKDIMTIKERESVALYRILKDLSMAKDLDSTLEIAVNHISNVFGCESVIFFPEGMKSLSREPHRTSNFIPDEMEWLAAEISFKEKERSRENNRYNAGCRRIIFPGNRRRFGSLCYRG